jgi:hypothetical protein
MDTPSSAAVDGFGLNDAAQVVVRLVLLIGVDVVKYGGSDDALRL